jgi:dsRNA-specific ribonuclease
MSDTEIKISHDDDIVKDENQDLIFDPFNPLNNEITLSEVQSILTSYGVPGKVHNINLYKRAFIHKSYVKRPQLENIENNITIVDKPDNCMSLKTKSNERLEFLGDGVLECITKYYLYRRFPKENEGFMTEKKIALVKNEHIGRLAYEMGLNKWYIISKHAEEKKTRTNLKKLGCLFEAFLGALFLDFNKISIHDEDNWFDNVFVTGPGFQIAQIFVENILEKHVNWMKLINEDDNYKNILQVKIQKEFKTTPKYLVIDNDEETGYEMGVYLAINIPVQEVVPENATPIEDKISFKTLQEELENDGQIFMLLGKSSHKIKKKAEQTACQIALSNIIDE